MTGDRYIESARVLELVDLVENRPYELIDDAQARADVCQILTMIGNIRMEWEACQLEAALLRKAKGDDL